MPVIERRVFYGKPGTADQIVEVCKEFIAMLDDGQRVARVLTDHLSGRTDRVVMELGAESLGAIETEMESMMQEQDLMAKFGAAFSKLVPLIDSAEVEYWTPR